jgi:hypothetical protein
MRLEKVNAIAAYSIRKPASTCVSSLNSRLLISHDSLFPPMLYVLTSKRTAILGEEWAERSPIPLFNPFSILCQFSKLYCYDYLRFSEEI